MERNPSPESQVRFDLSPMGEVIEPGFSDPSVMTKTLI